MPLIMLTSVPSLSGRSTCKHTRAQANPDVRQTYSSMQPTSQTSFVDGVSVGFWAVAPLPGVCPRGGSRLVSSVPLANPTCGSSDGRRSPLARPATSPTSSWDNGPLALPNTVCETGRVTPRPGGVLSEGKKPLASPTLGASVAGSTLLRPRASSWGCRARPHPKSGMPVLKPCMFGSI